MANWALVEDGEIKELHDLLPANWRSVSGLRLAVDDPEFLKTLGWISITKNHQDYDRSLYRESGVNHELLGDQVLETLVLTEKEQPPPPPPPPSFEETKAGFMRDLRQERNLRLSQSDWSQLPDVQTMLDDHEKSRWLDYRQSLRDLPEKYAATDHTELSGVDWPQAVGGGT